MIKINKKEMVMSIVALLFIVMVVIGITYAAFTYTGLGTKSNKVTTSTITMNYNEATNGITLSDAFPISDNDGKQLTGEGNTFGFTVTVTTGNNTAVGYEISAVKDTTSTLSNNDVRIYLEKSTTGAEGTYSSVLEPTGFNPINATTEIGTPTGEMILHSDSTTTTRTDYYILRMWVAEDYQVTGESKFFTIKVNVYGTDSHINTSGISLNKNSMTLDEGESEQLSATVLPEYATDKSVTWASSNTDVAVVDSSGNVTAQSISGTTATAVVTATDSKGHSATCTVTVNKPEPTGVEIEDNITELNLIAPGEASGETTDGSSAILEAGTLPANANSNEVEWTTSDSSVLDIERYTEANASGTGSSKSVIANKVKVTAKGAGSATLTVKSATNPSAPSKSITVTIEDPESTGLSIDKPNVTIDRNSSTQVTATLNLSNSRDKTIYWTSSDSTKASINCSGGSTNSSGEIETSGVSAVCTVTGLVAGSTTITARDAKGHTASSIVTVQNELASLLSLSSDAEMEVGASHIFQASVTPSDARNISSITWTSSNTSIATIPNNCAGSVTCEIEGLEEGTTNITVTIGSLSDTSQLDVVPAGTPVSSFVLGDYVSVTPSYSGSYSCVITGCSGSVTPSELNKWRVISKNNDGTIDMVSENVSSTQITFTGEDGYKYYVLALQDLASKYENSNYTKTTGGSRIMGYNGQTGYIGSTSLSTSSAGTTTTPTTITPEGVGQEYRTGYQGDTLYVKDYNAVNSALGTLVAKDANDKTTAKDYFLASRDYDYNNSSFQAWCLRYINASGELTWSGVRSYYNSSWSTGTKTRSLRPILTLKSGLKAKNGDGQSSNTAWSFE